MADHNYAKKAFRCILLTVFLILIDQWTKLLTLSHLKDAEPVVLIPKVLELLYIENRGAAFGMLIGKKLFFIAMAAVVTMLLFYMYLHTPQERKYFPLRLCMIGIMAGAIGNVIDRLRIGYVVDMIYFMPIDFPVFNFADICVTCAAFGIIVLLLFVYKDDDLKMIPFLGSRKDEQTHGV